MPLKNIQILPYNLDHSIQAGKFANVLFEKRNTGELNIDRNIIPNDVKMSAQANVEEKIGYYVTSDRASEDLIAILADELTLNFDFVNIETKHTERFGLLDL